MNRWLGLARSLIMYYGNPFKLWRMKRFYAPLIPPGALCFDIGAHVGNRLWVWSRLGAQVVAVEPQPLCMQWLQRCFGRRPGVTLVEAAVGATPGTAELWISERTPTVTTLSTDWINTVQQVASFAGVGWQTTVTVPVTTLDALIAHYGLPAFCKIDVEGYELEVIRGLSQPLPALSFEYIPAATTLAIDCITQLQMLGDYRYNWSIGEQHCWQHERWLTHHELCAMLTGLPPQAPSGDIYARQRLTVA